MFFKKKERKPIWNTKYHCGVCGIPLDDDDWLCPACGGPPVDANGKEK